MDGAKGGDQGKCGPAKHAPSTGSGRRVPSAGPHTESRKAKQDEGVTTLLHHVDVRLLRESYVSLRRDAPPGVDGMTWEDYGLDLESRLMDLHERVHRGAYRAAVPAGNDTQG